MIPGLRWKVEGIENEFWNVLKEMEALMDFNCLLKREKCSSCSLPEDISGVSFLCPGLPQVWNGSGGRTRQRGGSSCQLRAASNLPVPTHKIKGPPRVLIKNAK